MQEWQIFKEKHGNFYKNTFEERYRFEVFMENRKKIQEHNEVFNQGRVTYKMAVNKFANMTHNEFLEGFATHKMTAKKFRNNVFTGNVNEEIPISIDWREKGAVTDVKYQGNCDSGWAFSAIDAIEGQHQRASGKLVSLSEQQLLDCSPLTYGCAGGQMDHAFQYAMESPGIDTEESYNYTASEGRCVASSGEVGAKISNYTDILSGSESALTVAIATVGPISAAIDITSVNLMFYIEGVYYDPGCTNEYLDLGVLAVGYGNKDGSDYYIVKNSWSTEWGDQGYILMSRNRDNNCGIASLASFPVV